MTEALDEEPREDTLSSIIGEVYNQGTQNALVVLWVKWLFFLGIGIACGVLFWQSDDVKFQIAYGALFVCAMHWATLTKVVTRQSFYKNQIQREVKRLELQVLELMRTIGADDAAR